MADECVCVRLAGGVFRNTSFVSIKLIRVPLISLPADLLKGTTGCILVNKAMAKHGLPSFLPQRSKSFTKRENLANQT